MDVKYFCKRSRGQVIDLFTKKSKTCPSDLFTYKKYLKPPNISATFFVKNYTVGTVPTV